MIKFAHIDRNNLEDILSLRVSPEQSDYVLDNAISLAQAYAQEELQPLAIYDDETPVGFLMYCIDSDDGEYWLYRLMIDERFQRRGYGERAMKMLLTIIKTDKTRRRVFLGVDIRARAAVALYKKLGFEFNAQVFGKEHIMLLTY